jgi:hypothetical protein
MANAASSVMMVRPACFCFDEETAESNSFQVRDGLSARETQELGAAEFDSAVRALQAAGVSVMVIPDTEEPVKPDAVFPNNWISTHADGTLVTYPMFTASRRRERREDVVHLLKSQFVVSRHIAMEGFEAQDQFLEGTGSMVLDHGNRIAYACLSPRTTASVFREFCKQLGFEPVVFNAVDSQGKPVYHTNVVMAMSDKFAVVCLESVPREDERAMLQDRLTASNKTIVPITWAQTLAFAGNALQLRSSITGQPIFVMSDTARASLTAEQVQTIEQFTSILVVSVKAIERYGGGGIRCMICENFLPPRSLSQLICD